MNDNETIDMIKTIILRIVMTSYSYLVWLLLLVKRERTGGSTLDYCSYEILAEAFEALPNGELRIALRLTRKDRNVVHYQITSLVI